MAAAVGADDLDAAPVGIREMFDGPGDLVVETRPSAVGVKFVLRAVKWCIALPAEIDPFSFALKLKVIFSEGAFSPLAQDDVLLFGGKIVIWLFHDLCLTFKAVGCGKHLITRRDHFGVGVIGPLAGDQVGQLDDKLDI